MKRQILLLAATVATLTLQAERKPLTHDLYDNWKQIERPTLTNDGAWMAFEIAPQKGDGELILRSTLDSTKWLTIPRGTTPLFFGNSNYALIRVKQPEMVVRAAKVKKTKAADLPQDSLRLISLATLESTPLPYKSVAKTAENAPFLLFSEEITIPKDTTDKKSKERKYKRLSMTNLLKGDTLHIDSVGEFLIDKKANTLLYTVVGDSLKSVWSYQNGQKTELFHSKQGKLGKLTLDEEGGQLAFLATNDTAKTAPYRLFYTSSTELIRNKRQKVTEIVALEGERLPTGFGIGNDLSFSREGSRLHFSYARLPKPEVKDTLLAEEKFSLDLWSYNDTINMPQQLVEAKKLREESFTAIYFTKEKRWQIMTTPQFNTIAFPTDERGATGMCIDTKPYLWAANWENPFPRDVYAVDLKSNERKLVRQKLLGNAYLSPDGRFIILFDRNDAQWYAYESATQITRNISNRIQFPLFDESADRPEAPTTYGAFGYSPDYNTIYVYDKYDAWSLDLTGKKSPHSVTTNWGRENQTTLRYFDIFVDNFNKVVDFSHPALFHSFNESNKESGFYHIKAGSLPIQLLESGHRYTLRAKAKESNRILFQRENFNEFRDLWLSDLNLTTPQKVSNANPQMGNYKWGSVEVMKWRDFNGKEIEGLLYKPENYDPSKRYPTVVYFYETHSQELYRHHHPQPSWSIIIPSMFTSNDYVVFMPNISYTDGYPGESCYNAVVSGATALIDRGISDPERIGLQGQSWGGYQIAYLVTRTNMFRCASPGTPVSNMTSAYSGIRNGSGLVRMFQYEFGQSRIGATLWDAPMRYIENSPLFYAPKVETPMLIRHCDADEAVPFAQGVELFMALKRNGKKAWLLNYNREAHNLRTRPARMDWTIRMHQFFDFFLKDSPEPRWMKEGISIVEKGIDQKYDTVE